MYGWSNCVKKVTVASSSTADRRAVGPATSSPRPVEASKGPTTMRTPPAISRRLGKRKIAGTPIAGPSASVHHPLIRTPTRKRAHPTALTAYPSRIRELARRVRRHASTPVTTRKSARTTHAAWNGISEPLGRGDRFRVIHAYSYPALTRMAARPTKPQSNAVPASHQRVHAAGRPFPSIAGASPVASRVAIPRVACTGPAATAIRIVDATGAKREHAWRGGDRQV